MTSVQSIILGVIEGITEYLPISSTGHLVVAQRLMGMGNGVDKEASDAFAICIQGGAIAAVLGLYFPRVKDMLLGLLGKNPAGLKLLINLIAAFIPAAIAGVLFDDKIEQVLFGLKPVCVAWFVGGIVILLLSRNKKLDHGTASLEQLTWKSAVVIGLLQCIAMWPGTSRSLMTILGGLFVGMRKKDAVEFSFLLGVMTLGAATCKKGLDSGAIMYHTYGSLNISLGFIAAAVSAALAVKWLVTYLQKHNLSIFGYYRIILALVVYYFFAR